MFCKFQVAAETDLKITPSSDATNSQHLRKYFKNTNTEILEIMLSRLGSHHEIVFNLSSSPFTAYHIRFYEQ